MDLVWNFQKILEVLMCSTHVINTEIQKKLCYIFLSKVAELDRVVGRITIQVRAYLYPVTGGVFHGRYFSQLFAICVKNFPFSYLTRHSV